MPMQTKTRLIALDVFRGMTVCFMIIVNTPGNYNKVFAPLNHAEWNGCTPTDMVFPSFLFAVGIAISFALSRWQTEPGSKVLIKIFKRTVVIFVLGYLLMYPYSMMMKPQPHSIFPPFSETLLFGVLQRISLTYCAASLLFYYFKPKTVAIICISILAVYWPVLVFFGSGPDPLNPHSNAVLKLDTFLWGAGHLWIGEGYLFDPEGFLSTFPAIVTVAAGCFAGKFVQANGKNYEGLAKLLMVGFACFFIAYWWNFGFPINKKLWTSPFVLHTVGLDCMILACIIYLLDFRKINNGVYFFQVFGRNALFIYFFSMLVGLAFLIIPVGKTRLSLWIYEHFFIYAGEYLGSLLFAIAFMLVCWLTGYILDQKKIYIKV
jgi:predicted acyltransferase